jgi:Patatin-like phospholipase
MAKSSRCSATGCARADTVYSLAEVLEDEFRDLHENAPRKEDGAATKRQQPLADPSLAELGPSSPQPHTDVRNADKLSALWDEIHKLSGDGRTALCLSGGGVRSAAFNLGVLQGLARLGLLHRFHYLSTVSGGGYIGCWLSAWRHRFGIADVSRGLSWPDPLESAESAEVSRQVPSAISNLRCFTNYLTPSAGLLSPDTWTSIVIIGRNLLLNHIVIVPLVAALLVLAKLIEVVGNEQPMPLWQWWTDYLHGTRLEGVIAAEYVGSFLVPGVLAALGWITLSLSRPSWDDASTIPETIPPANDRGAQFWLPWVGIGLVVLGAILFGLIVPKRFPLGHSSWSWHRFMAFPLGGGVGSLFGFLLAIAVAIARNNRRGLPKDLGDFLRSMLESGRITVPTSGFGAISLFAAAAFVAGSFGGCVLGVGEELAAILRSGDPLCNALILSIAPFWFVISYSVGEGVYLGLTARKPRARFRNWNDRWGEQEREWVARTVGWISLLGLGTSFVLLISLFGAYFLEVVTSRFEWEGPLGLVTVGVLSALASIGLAASPFSTHFGTASRGVRLPVRKILAVATPIFAALLASLISIAIDFILFGQPLLKVLDHQGSQGLLDPTARSGPFWLLVVFGGLLAVSCIAARFVNINRFSLYDFYRMRLTREFLGASNANRRSDAWTGFDSTDDIPLADIWPPKKDQEKVLYPVINATLNMAATKKLEWQERKAVSFVFTPNYCGSGATRNLGFRETSGYASGIKLGWAMSISGAAVSPNAGYTTLPGLALLMTLFNLRLGVWSGNPGADGQETSRLRGPRFALQPLISEALALTNDRSKYVYLSDGGHFDNLGLYEMLRRRCRLIVISDATSDPDYVYADLGSVMRRAAIDFGIRITFEHLDMAGRGETAVKGAYSGSAIIEYPEMQPNGQRQRGHLLYIKSFCAGFNEPADVRAYYHTNPAFPHDTTLDQFFGETQFESYRVLGCYTVMELARRAGFDVAKQGAKPADLGSFFKGVQMWLRRGDMPDKPASGFLRPAKPILFRRQHHHEKRRHSSPQPNIS